MSEQTEVGSIVADSTITTPSVQVYQQGDKIGGEYLVHEVIRDGGMADVYFCFNIYTDKPYALKTFKPQYWANQQIRQLFEQEIRTWVTLEKHPNIVRCHYLTTFDDLPFMVLEWVADPQRERVDLRHWLKQYGALSLRQALNIMIDVCRGLSHAQQKQPGLVHRDLKPANILLTADQMAKITDFGLATLSQAAQLGLNELLEDLGNSASLVQLGSFVGTPDYAAPEQWHGGVVDSRADIYALGCLLYEMVTGQRPFKVDLSRQDRAAWLEAWYAAHVDSLLPTLPATLPSALHEVIHSCLQKEPTQRLGEVDVLLSKLEQIYQQQFDEVRPKPVVEKFEIMDYFLRARTYSQLNDAEKALEDYNEVIQLNPNLISAYNHRGRIYAEKGDYDQAIADYTEAIRVDPQNSTAYNSRGIAYAEKGNDDQAIADYTESIRLEPENSAAYNNRGSAYARKGDYDQAIANYNESIRLDPIWATDYFNRGRAYAEKGDYDQAIADYNESIRLDPKKGTTYYRRGIAYAKKEIFDQAIADYTKAIQLNPKDDLAYTNRGIAYAQKMDYDQAIADYNQAIQLAPAKTLPYLKRARAYRGKKDYDAAIADYTKAIELDPNSVSNYQNRGITYAEKGDYDQAIADHTETIRLSPPQYKEFYYRYRGHVYSTKLKQYDKAIADYKKSLELAPQRANTYRLIGLSLTMLGVSLMKPDEENNIPEIEEGKKYFRKAIELDPSLADELAQYLDDEA